MASGDTKTEAMLNVLGNGGSGDEFRGCCNTKTQSYILDAIDRINSLTPGGSSDFNDLSNRPQLNGAQMTGSTNITNFTGTDGNTAGAQGLVPAPATTDAGKFLKADGTWDTAGGGGGTKSLTRADYNYPTENPYGVATWTLEEGIYKNTDENYIELCFSTSNTHRIQSGGSFLVLRFGFGEIFVLYGMDNYTNLGYLATRPDGSVGFEYSAMNTTKILNNLETTGPGFALDARQGKALNDKITSIAIRGAQDPNETTAASIGTIFENTTNGSLWICEGVDDPGSPTEYYWMQIASTDYVDQVGNTLSGSIQNGSTSAPTTATYGEVGTLYSAVVSGVPHVYMCTEYNDVDDEYIWAQIV